jgi:pimeloyl-ACP methyl ester carboxylesterase
VTTPIHTQFRTIDGLSIRFAESEPRDEHALLFSPWPESLFALAPTWERLAENVHLVAVDLPGFGHSEGRDELLSPRAMGEFVVRWRTRSGSIRPTQSARTSAPLRCPLRRLRIPAGSGASLSAPAQLRIRASSASPWPGGSNHRISTPF